MSKLTPMMKQYFSIKEKYNDSILFFRLGDFYEMFFDDAITASRELEITLTGRVCGQDEKAPMCGIPFHSAESYIAKLISKGYKVAICEQVEDASEAVGIVKRDVVRIVTPGTVTDTKLLDEKNNNYLCSIYLDDTGLGISYVDITTGELYTTEVIESENKLYDILIDELGKISPTEIITNEYLYNKKDYINKLRNKFNVIINKYHEWSYETNTALNCIKNQLNVITLSGFGINDNKYCISSTGSLIEYLNETQKTTLSHLNTINFYYISNYMILDINTRKNLELTETIKDNNKKGSLLWLLDKTSTSMGARLLKKWVEQPLINKDEIMRRLNTIQYLTNDILLMDDIKNTLDKVYDLERLLGKISYGSCNGRDLLALKNSINVLPNLKNILSNSNSNNLKDLGNNLDTLEDVYKLIDESILDNPPVSIKEGGLIKKDYNNELKELIEASIEGKNWLSSLETNEKNRTGIKSLKVGFNKVFGYYIEITKSNLNLVPNDYIRKQTLSNAERYITPELKEMESKILGAEERSMKLEYEIFMEVREKINTHIRRIQECAKIVSNVDAINSLSLVAFKNNYIKPEINDEGIIDIKNGRHPVVEKMLNDELFVPNDTYLNKNDNRISIITGPNMAGKSTYMRQVALITLLCHIGSFVPAEEANICIVDRIFTRIGASDDLSQGKSTFMVEMSEVANILNNSTSNSLLILDEIGRGTSTYDGLSIAWSVIEYISDKNKCGSKTLFATHYHELTELEGKLDGVDNYNILVQEQGEDIIFLRKISHGGADKSYGIEVARLAGVPNEVIKRAKEILLKLENNNDNSTNNENVYKEVSICENLDINYQLNLFDSKSNNIIEKLKNIDLLNTSPIEAINILYSLVNEVKDK